MQNFFKLAAVFSRLGDVGCTHIPGSLSSLRYQGGSGLAWGSWGGCASKGRQLGRMCQVLLDLQWLVPGGWDPNLQIQVGLPGAHSCIGHLKKDVSAGKEELWNVTWSLSLPSPGTFYSNPRPCKGTFCKAPVAGGIQVGHEEVLPPCGHVL